jgi:hypothetical protein
VSSNGEKQKQQNERAAIQIQRGIRFRNEHGSKRIDESRFAKSGKITAA